MTEPTVHHLRAERDLDVPSADQPLLVEYWRKMRRLRAQVEEGLLADADIAVTWSATGDENR